MSKGAVATISSPLDGTFCLHKSKVPVFSSVGTGGKSGTSCGFASKT